MPGKDPLPLNLALERRIDQRGEGGCWTWTGAFGHDGYGRYTHEGRAHQAHRLVFEVLGRQAIPPGAILRHLCNNRRCVRPEHLRPGTRAQNALDQWRAGHRPEGTLPAQYVLDLRVRWFGGRLTRAWLVQEGVRTGMDPRTIARIARFETYRQLPPLPPPSFPLPEGVAYDPRPIHAAARSEGWIACVMLPEDETLVRETSARFARLRRWHERMARDEWPCWRDQPTAIELAASAQGGDFLAELDRATGHAHRVERVSIGADVAPADLAALAAEIAASHPLARVERALEAP